MMLSPSMEFFSLLEVATGRAPLVDDRPGDREQERRNHLIDPFHVRLNALTTHFARVTPNAELLGIGGSDNSLQDTTSRSLAFPVNLHGVTELAAKRLRHLQESFCDSGTTTTWPA
jgi:hypothetical protein